MSKAYWAGMYKMYIHVPFTDSGIWVGAPGVYKKTPAAVATSAFSLQQTVVCRYSYYMHVYTYLISEGALSQHQPLTEKWECMQNLGLHLFM